MKGNIFNSVVFNKVKSNTFDLSHDVKMSFNMGKLYPIHWMECLPGDTIYGSTESMLRFSPLVAPVMHRVHVFTHTFFVPNRILWDGWQEFITGGQDPSDTPAHPYFAAASIPSKSLGDFLGMPTGVGNIEKFNALPYAAYQAIYNEYYRDQNLVPEVDYKLTDGANQGILHARWLNDFNVIRTRAWQHDYFTASLPFAQKGDPVTFTSGEVTLNPDSSALGLWKAADGITTMDNGQILADPDGSLPATKAFAVNDPGTGSVGVQYDPNGTLQTAAVTINDLRVALALQSWLETNARGGSRYIESIKAHFDENVPDATLQRPQFLGGSKSNMVISEVLQTSETSDTSPQGNMSGHGISVDGGKSWKYHCVEHGIMMTIVSVMPLTAYQQGLHRSWSRFDRLDYYWPTFAHLGEQEVKNQEVYYANDGENLNTFGYVPRYAEYRYQDSRVAGEMRTNLAYWHMGRIFGSRPHLNKEFIECDPGRRFFAVEDEDFDTIYAHFYMSIKARRKIPVFGIPKLIG